jgi:hypothetical protein
MHTSCRVELQYLTASIKSWFRLFQSSTSRKVHKFDPRAFAVTRKRRHIDQDSRGVTCCAVSALTPSVRRPLRPFLTHVRDGSGRIQLRPQCSESIVSFRCRRNPRRDSAASLSGRNATKVLHRRCCRYRLSWEAPLVVVTFR